MKFKDDYPDLVGLPSHKIFESMNLNIIKIPNDLWFIIQNLLETSFELIV